MYAEKEISLCLKLFAMTDSPMGDGEVASLKLQERMERGGLDFGALFDYVCDHEDDYAYQAEHFFRLMDRVHRTDKSTVMRHDPESDTASSEEAESTRIRVKEHTRTSKTGKVYNVRAHQRHCKRRANAYDWRKDPLADPGADFEWIEGHERWHSHAGHGRKIRVRGYWRRRTRYTMRKAA